MSYVGRIIPGPEVSTKGTIIVHVRLLLLVYRIVMRWNTREGAWMVSIFDPTNRPIERDIWANAGEDILENVIRPYAPAGAVVVRDKTGGDRDPERDGWIKGIVLRYEYEVAA